jgi:hypothetical protein
MTTVYNHPSLRATKWNTYDGIPCPDFHLIQHSPDFFGLWLQEWIANRYFENNNGQNLSFKAFEAIIQEAFCYFLYHERFDVSKFLLRTVTDKFPIPAAVANNIFYENDLRFLESTILRLWNLYDPNYNASSSFTGLFLSRVQVTTTECELTFQVLPRNQ